MATPNINTTNDEAEIEAAAAFSASQAPNSLPVNPVLAQTAKAAPKRSISPPPESLPVEFIDAGTSDPLSVVQAAIDEATVKGAAESKKIQGAFSSAARQGEVLTERAADITKDKVTIKRQEVISTMEAEKASLEFAKARGIEDLPRLARSAKVTQTDLEAKDQEIIDNSNIDAATHGILAWFLADLRSGPLQEERAAIAQKLDTQNNAIQNTAALSSQVDKTLNDVRITQTDATLISQTRIAAAEQTEKATKISMQSKLTGAEASMQALNNTIREGQAARDKYALRMQERQRLASAEQIKLTLKRAEKDENFADNLHSGWRQGMIKQGLGDILADETDKTAMEAEKDTVLTQYNVPGDSRDRAIKAFSIGTGATPLTGSQSLKAIRTINPKLIADGTNRAVNLVVKANNDAVATEKAKLTGGKLTQEVVDVTADVNTEAYWANANAEIVSGDFKNPNHAIPMSELIDKEGLKDNPIIQEHIAPLFADGKLKDISVETLLGLSKGIVKTKTNPEGKYSLEEWADTVDAIFTKAANYNTSQQEREFLDYPPQLTYNAKFEAATGAVAYAYDVFALGGLVDEGDVGVFFDDNTIDLMDGVQIRKAIVLILTGRSLVARKILSEGELPIELPKSIVPGSK